jgi:hypothetical protein
MREVTPKLERDHEKVTENVRLYAAYRHLNDETTLLTNLNRHESRITHAFHKSLAIVLKQKSQSEPNHPQKGGPKPSPQPRPQPGPEPQKVPESPAVGDSGQNSSHSGEVSPSAPCPTGRFSSANPAPRRNCRLQSKTLKTPESARPRSDSLFRRIHGRRPSMRTRIAASRERNLTFQSTLTAAVFYNSFTP